MAYEKYSDPLLRPRIDTDVLIDQKDQTAVFVVLESNGYQPLPNQENILGQKTFVKVCGEASFIYDIHWHLFAPQLLRGLFTFEELWFTRVPMASLPAHTIADEQALIVSGVHWVGHHLLTPEVHWISDIQLLARDRDPFWWNQFKRDCRHKKVQKIMHQVLSFSGVPSPWSEDELQVISEETAYFLKSNRTSFTDAYQDWIYLNWPQRLSYLYGHLIPQKEWMFKKYGPEKAFLLPYLYLRRIVEGFLKVILSR